MVGACLCWPRARDDPEAGYVGELAVRKSWRRRGLGLALLQHAFRGFKERGKLRAVLHVDSENITGAIRLYERAGMYVDRLFHTYELELRPGEDLTVR